MTTVQEGGCLCGRVRFKVQGEPLRVGLCHCTDCRRSSGSAFGAFAIFRRDAYQGTGELATYTGRSFCLQCGSRVVNLSEDEAEVMLGCFDQAPTNFVPRYELWIGRREHWLAPVPRIDQFEQDRY